MRSETFHPAESDFQEFLDGEMPPDRSARFEAHIKTCADCQALLAHWQQAFERIASLPDVEMPYDLSRAVISRIKPAAASRGSVLMLLAEAALGAGVAALIWPFISAVMTDAATSLGLSFRSEMDAARFSFQSWLASIDLFSRLDLGHLSIEAFLSESTFLPLAALVLLVLLAGNGLILKTTQPDRQRRRR